MRATIVAAVVLAGIPTAGALEAVPREEALKAAVALCRDLPKMLDTPIPTDPDVKRLVGVHVHDRGLLVFPESKLCVDCVAKAGSQAAPIGQMWMLKIALVVGGQSAASDTLHLVSVSSEKGEAVVGLYALGVRKGADGQPELLVYGKDKEPLLKAALAKISEKQENPIEVSAEQQGDGAVVTLKILGQYSAQVPIGTAE